MDNRYAVLSSGVVVNLILWDGQSNWTPPEGTTVHLIPADSPVSIGYTFDGTSFTAPPAPAVPPLSPEALQASLVAAVQLIMDTKAKTYGYDDLTTAVTYADEPSVPKFQQEGQAFRAWRSAVWDACYAYLAYIQAGSKPFPQASDLPGLLPTFPLDSTAS